MGNQSVTEFFQKNNIFSSIFMTFRQKFILYVQQNNLLKFKTLFQQNSSTDFHSIVDGYGNNLLHLAAGRESIDMVKFIVESRKLNIDDRNIYGDTALFIASLKGNLTIIQYLLRQGADPNIPDKMGHTPFMAVSANGYHNLIKYFLHFNNINFKAKNMNGQTVIHRCAFHGELQAIKMIYKKKKLSLTQKDSRDNTALHLAAQKLNIRTMRFLMRKLENNCLTQLNSDNLSPIDIMEQQLNHIVSLQEKDLKKIEANQINKYLQDKQYLPESLKQLLMHCKIADIGKLQLTNQLGSPLKPIKLEVISDQHSDHDQSYQNRIKQQIQNKQQEYSYYEQPDNKNNTLDQSEKHSNEYCYSQEYQDDNELGFQVHRISVQQQQPSFKIKVIKQHPVGFNIADDIQEFKQNMQLGFYE